MKTVSRRRVIAGTVATSMTALAGARVQSSVGDPALTAAAALQLADADHAAAVKALDQAEAALLSDGRLVRAPHPVGPPAALRAYSAQRSRLGLDQLESDVDRASARWEEAGRALARSLAGSSAGVVAKLEVVSDGLRNGETSWTSAVLDSALADVRRLGALPPS